MSIRNWFSRKPGRPAVPARRRAPALGCERMEDRLNPGASYIAVGGSNGTISIIDETNGAILAQNLTPFAGYTGRLSVAVSRNGAGFDVDGDGNRDLVVGTQFGNNNVNISRVQVFKGADLVGAAGTQKLTPMMTNPIVPYLDKFNVGVNVGVGDVNGDGNADVVLGASAGNPNVRIFSGALIKTNTIVFDAGAANADTPTTSMLASWFSQAVGFNVSATIGVGNIMGHPIGGKQIEDVVTGTTLGNPNVRVWNGTAIANKTINLNAWGAAGTNTNNTTTSPTADGFFVTEFFAAPTGTNRGVWVDVGNFDGDANEDIVVSVVQGFTTGTPLPDPTGPSTQKVLDVRVFAGKTIANGTFKYGKPAAGQNANAFDPGATISADLLATWADPSLGGMTVAARELTGAAPNEIVLGTYFGNPAFPQATVRAIKFVAGTNNANLQIVNGVNRQIADTGGIFVG